MAPSSLSQPIRDPEKINMVYIDKPRKGCSACRIRRIKCDEQLPECSQCIKTRRKCPGYKERSHSASKDQTSISTQQEVAERRQWATDQLSLRNKRSKSLIDFTSPYEFEAVTPSYSDPGSLPTPMPESPWEPSLNFFFSTYARPSQYKDETSGFLENIAPLYYRAAPHSTLQYSTLAVAAFLLGAWMNRSHDSQISRLCYANAVSAMKEQLTSATACSNDEMLMSILLLQLYESLVGTLKKSTSSRAHLNGAMAIVKHRGVNSFNTKLSHGLLLCIRGQLIEESFKLHRHPPPDIHTWAHVRLESDQSPVTRLETIKLDLATVQANLSSALNGKTEARTRNIASIYGQAEEIERRLQLWYSGLPPSWYPVRIKDGIPEDIFKAGLYRQLCDVYLSISIAGTFNKYRVTLIQTRSVQLTCLSQQPRSLPSLASQAACINQIQQTADDICASVPFHLGDKTMPGWLGDTSVNYPCDPGKELPEGHYQMATAMGGWLLLEPFGGLLMMKIKLRPGQREWIGGQMMRISKIYNFRA